MKKITIYSTPTCHFCHMAKDYFKENKIEFTDFDVSLDLQRRKEMVDLTGQMGVPVIVIEGNDPIIGFNRTMVENILKS